MTKVTSCSTLMIGLVVLSVCGLPLSAQVDSPRMSFRHPVHFAVSPPLRELAKLPPHRPYGFHEETEPVRYVDRHPGRILGHPADPVEQRVPSSPSGISVGLSVLGVHNVNSLWPPDTNAAVGDTQVVEWVNTSYAVYNKSTGALEAGPFDGNLLWQALGGSCYNENGGDIIAQWDKVNHRWLLAQNFFDYLHNDDPPFYACVAVSTSADATGTYYEYQFPLGNNFPDYPKWGIWPSGYFQTQNDVDLTTGFIGAYVCAYNTVKLIVGDPTAEQICFQTTPNDIHRLHLRLIRMNFSLAATMWIKPKTTCICTPCILILRIPASQRSLGPAWPIPSRFLPTRRSARC
jgi:hypothetical protein